MFNRYTEISKCLCDYMVVQGRRVWFQIPFQGVFFELINQFTIIKFQLIAVEYTGLQFTKGFFNPKPKMGWTLKLKISKFADFFKHRKWKFLK